MEERQTGRQYPLFVICPGFDGFVDGTTVIPGRMASPNSRRPGVDYPAGPRDVPPFTRPKPEQRPVSRRPGVDYPAQPVSGAGSTMLQQGVGNAISNHPLAALAAGAVVIGLAAMSSNKLIRYPAYIVLLMLALAAVVQLQRQGVF